MKRIYPLLKECRSRITYHKLLLGSHGAILKKMKKTKSIFIHIPKTGGKSILKGVYGISLHDGFGHARAGFYLSVFGQSIFKKYFKFAFVRNPWDRAYSGYYFARKGGFGFKEDLTLENELKNISFEKFVKIWLPKQDLNSLPLIIFHPQYKFICDSDGALMVDRVCYFEDMKTELLNLSSRFKISANFIHLNKSVYTRSYQDSYDNEMRDVIQDLYYKDIKTFGYLFNGRSGS